MKISRKLILTIALFVVALSPLGLASAEALSVPSIEIVAATSKDDACHGLNQLGGTGCGGGQSSINNILHTVVSILSYIAGVIAIIMIIVSGIRFMTSAGDSSKVAAAKTALIYALIGIAVAGLAQFFVQVILSTAYANT